MIVVIDNNVLIQLLKNSIISDKISSFLQTNDARLLLPAPVLAEYLAYDFVHRQALFLSSSNARTSVTPFDQLSAIACGEMAYKLNSTKQKQPGQKAKVDLQIIAIAQSHGAKIILSDDPDLKNMVEQLGLAIEVKSTNNLSAGDLFDGIT